MIKLNDKDMLHHELITALTSIPHRPYTMTSNHIVADNEN